MKDQNIILDYILLSGIKLWEHIKNVSDLLKVGDVFDVKYFGFDPRTKKEKVSRKAILPKPEGFKERSRDHKAGNRGRDNRGRDNRNRDNRRDDRRPREDKRD